MEKFVYDEYESKKIIGNYGIPVAPGTLMHETSELKDACRQLEYPVVIKGCGKALLHKSEYSLVHLGVTNDTEAEKAAAEIWNSDAPVEDILIQKQIKGKREFIFGIKRDDSFGTLIAFGLGGILAEALEKISFRLAPLNHYDAVSMIEEVGVSKLLTSFRGEDAIDIEDLIQILMSLSKLAIENPDVKEVDINPVIADIHGKLFAVDALIIKEEQEPVSNRSPRIAPEVIERILEAKSIAFVGATDRIGSFGNFLPAISDAADFIGKFYYVNPDKENIAGVKCFKNLSELPEKVELVVIVVPAPAVIDIVKEMKVCGLENAIVVTSGFSETGEEGHVLEDELIVFAKGNGINFFGPNVMGVINPLNKLNISVMKMDLVPGCTTMASHSGNVGGMALSSCLSKGIGIRGFLALGNESIIGMEDVIDFLIEDEKTKVACLYVETVASGLGFYKQIKKLSSLKPVVLLKGGDTDSGSAAASSHTGAMATNQVVFNAACAQAGIIKINNLDDFAVYSSVFSYLPEMRGNRVAIITTGGGLGVNTADLCEKYGLSVPALPPEIIEKINPYLPPFWSHGNPVDLVWVQDVAAWGMILEELLKWDGCDAVIHIAMHAQRDIQSDYFNCLDKSCFAYPEGLSAQLCEKAKASEGAWLDMVLDKMKEYRKPIIGIGGRLEKAEQKFVYKTDDEDKLGIVTFLSAENAVKGLSGMHKYNLFKEGIAL